MLDDSPMKRRQVFAILLALSIAILDGFDLSSLSFVAPVLGKQWDLAKSSMGLLLASGLVGMALGSIALTPLADRWGRRPIVLVSLALVTLGTLACALSPSLHPLLASRAVTGLGMGTLVPLLAAMAAEFANARYRSSAVAFITIGLPLGGSVGGVVSAGVLRTHDPQVVFLIGAAAGAVMMALAALALPETPSFLINRRPGDALARLNRTRHQLGHGPIDQLPPADQAVPKGTYRALFSPELAPDTIRLIASNVLIVIGAFYVVSWFPQIMTGLGFGVATASLVVSASNLIGISSPLIFGVVSARVDPARIATALMIGVGLALLAIGFAPPVLAVFAAVACSCTFFIAGSAAMFQATVVRTFSPALRASALGCILGIGRVGSGLGPFLAGVMFSAGLSRGTVSLCFASLAVVAGVLVGLRRRGQP